MDFKQIQTIIRNFEKSSLTELLIEADDIKIKMSKLTQEREVSTDEQASKGADNSLFEVKSPLVGSFYLTNPKGEEFVSVGSKVQEGDVICIIEAMKIMNEITASKSGVIEDIKIRNADPVGFDQVLMTIRV